MPHLARTPGRLLRTVCPAVALLCLVLGACASTAPTAVTSYQTGERPEPGVRATVDVGDVLYTQFDFLQKDGARLTDGYNEKHLLGRVEIPAGTFLLARRNDGEIEFCTEDRRYIDPLSGPYDIVCFRDTRDGGQFNLMRVPSTKFGAWTTLTENLPSYREQAARETQGFRKELLYQGVSGEVLRISYREYVNDMARPAFTQDITYNLEADGPTEIRFQGAVIEVFEAGNNQLDYQVVQGFRD